MGSRLDRITDWEERARKAGFRTVRLAINAGVTRQQLTRYFRIRFGLTPRIWIERLRISDGIRLLRQGKLIKEAAQDLGFQHSTHLSRAFRRDLGTSPTVLAHDEQAVLGCSKHQNVPNRSEMFPKGLSNSLPEKRGAPQSGCRSKKPSQTKRL